MTNGYAVVEPSQNSKLPDGLVVGSSLVDVEGGLVPVQITNVLDRPLSLKAGVVMCQVDIMPLVSISGPTAGCNHVGLDGLDNENRRKESNQSSGEGQISTKTVSLDNFDLSGVSLTPGETEAANELLRRNGAVFASTDTDLGCAVGVKHRIPLSDETPFKERHRRIPPSQFDEARQAIRDMLDAGVIRTSYSPYASPIVLVRKKDGRLRLCVDFRKLNAKTIKDAYALPRTEETLDALSGAKWFSSLDLQSGYWQIEIEEGDKPKTAFTSPLGFYEFNRMAFGLSNTPASFQRLMETCMGVLNLQKCLVYLDDVIVYSATFEEHLERLHSVLQRLQQYNLKLKPSKCHPSCSESRSTI